MTICPGAFKTLNTKGLSGGLSSRLIIVCIITLCRDKSTIWQCVVLLYRANSCSKKKGGGGREIGL